jgi:hypothetical protein
MRKCVNVNAQPRVGIFRSIAAATLFSAIVTSPLAARAQENQANDETQHQANNETQQGTASLAKTAFFYADPQVLNSEQHKDLRISMPQNMDFAADSQAVPVLMSEFADVALEYPIVFVKTPDSSWLSLALTGLNAGQNIFVDANGVWGANYIPASVRRYPFVLASDEDGTLSMAVDMAMKSDDEASVRLFDDAGSPSDVVKKAIPFLKSFQDQSIQTNAMIANFEKLGLLTDAQFQIQDQEGNPRNLNGFFIVDESKLTTLRDDKILDLVRGGQMSALYLQLLSLKNIAALQRRQAAAQ